MRVGVALVLLLLAGCKMQAEPEPIWIGHLAPVGGEAAVRAIKLDIEELKAAGKTFGGRAVWVRHVDSGNKATSRAEAVRLLAVNRVVALIVGRGVEGVEDVIASAKAHGAAVVVIERDAARPASGEWAARYEKRVGVAPTADAAEAHDALAILLTGLAECEAPTRADLLKATDKLESHDGVSGALRRVNGRWRSDSAR